MRKFKYFSPSVNINELSKTRSNKRGYNKSYSIDAYSDVNADNYFNNNKSDSQNNSNTEDKPNDAIKKIPIIYKPFQENNNETNIIKQHNLQTRKRNLESKKIKQNKKILLIVFLLITVFLLEFIFRESLEKFSEIFYLKLNPMQPQDKPLTAPRCILLKKLSFFEFQGKYILIFLIFNFSNIFAAFSFILLDSAAVFLNGILKVLYNQPRPFWRNENYLPCFCSLNFGGPSTTALDQFLLFIVIYKSFTHEKGTKMVKKIMIGFVCVFLFFSICLARLLQSAHSINQILLGFTLGFSVYFIYFEILKVNFSKKTQFKFFIDNSKQIIVAVIALFVLGTLLHEILNLVFAGNAKFKEDKILWKNLMSKYCEIIPINLFDNETYFKSTVLFLFFGVQIGIYSEFLLRFNKNYQHFSQYYFEGSKKHLYLKKSDNAEIRKLDPIEKEVLDKEVYYSQGKIISNKLLKREREIGLEPKANYYNKADADFFSFKDSLDNSANKVHSTTNSYLYLGPYGNSNKSINANESISSNYFTNQSKAYNNNNTIVYKDNSAKNSAKFNNSINKPDLSNRPLTSSKFNSYLKDSNNNIMQNYEIKEESENEHSDEESTVNQIIIFDDKLKSESKIKNEEEEFKQIKNKYFYNNTNYLKSLFRFSLMIMIYYALYKYVLIFGDVRKDSLLYLISFKFAFCNLIYGITFFFIFPNISSFLYLANDTLFYELDKNYEADKNSFKDNKVNKYSFNDNNDNNYLCLSTNLTEELIGKNENWKNEEKKNLSRINLPNTAEPVVPKRKISEIEHFLNEVEDRENIKNLNIDKLQGRQKNMENDYISLDDIIDIKDDKQVLKDIEELKVRDFKNEEEKQNFRMKKPN